jgi:hypothetical protein
METEIASLVYKPYKQWGFRKPLMDESGSFVMQNLLFGFPAEKALSSINFDF